MSLPLWAPLGLGALIAGLSGCASASHRITAPVVAPPPRASAPSAAQAAWLRGRILASQGDPAAVDALVVVLRLDPGARTPVIGLAQATDAAGDGAGALALLASAVEARPEDPALWLALGQQAARAGEAGQAERALSQSIALDPAFQSGEASAALVGLLLDQGQAERAAGLLAGLKPRDGAAFGARGLLRLRLGQVEAGLDDLGAALALAPAAPPLLSALLQTAVTARRFRSAARLLARAATRWPEDPRIAETRLRVAAAGGDPLEAASALAAWPEGAPGWAREIAAAVRPHPDEAAQRLLAEGQAAAAAGALPAACAALEAGLEALPADATGWSALAAVLSALGREGEAGLARERASRYAAWRSKR